MRSIYFAVLVKWNSIDQFFATKILAKQYAKPIQSYVCKALCLQYFFFCFNIDVNRQNVKYSTVNNEVYGYVHNFNKPLNSRVYSIVDEYMHIFFACPSLRRAVMCNNCQ
jgi:hypothetical protein